MLKLTTLALAAGFILFLVPSAQAEGIVSALCHAVIDNTQPPPEELRPACILIGSEEPGDLEDFVVGEVQNVNGYVGAKVQCILETQIGNVLDIRFCFQ